MFKKVKRDIKNRKIKAKNRAKNLFEKTIFLKNDAKSEYTHQLFLDELKMLTNNDKKSKYTYELFLDELKNSQRNNYTLTLSRIKNQ